MSVDVSAARAMPGVTVVEDGAFVGVASASSHDAARAHAAITAAWEPASGQPDSEWLFEHLVATPREGGRGAR